MSEEHFENSEELFATFGITIAVGAVVALAAYLVVSKLKNRNSNKLTPTTRVVTDESSSSDDETAGSPTRVRFEVLDQQQQEQQQEEGNESSAPYEEMEAIMSEETTMDEMAPKGSIDCSSFTETYPDAVSEVLRAWSAQGPSSLNTVLPLADTPASGSTRTDGHRWYSTALVASTPIPSQKTVGNEEDTNDDEEDEEALATSGVCRLVLVNKTLSLYSLDEQAEVTSRRIEGCTADQYFISAKTGGVIPPGRGDKYIGATTTPFLNDGDVLVGRVVLPTNTNTTMSVEPTYVQSHITGAFTVTLRLLTPSQKSGQTNDDDEEEEEEAASRIVNPVSVTSDTLVYGPDFAIPQASVSLSFETYYEAQLWHRMLEARMMSFHSEDVAATKKDQQPASSSSLFNALGYSSVLTTAFGRGVLAHGAKLVEDLLSAHDYIYDASSEGGAAAKLPKGFRIRGPNDFLIEPETAVIPPRAVLLHARQTTINSLSTHASHRSCCGVGMLPLENDEGDNRTVVLNLVDLRVGQMCEGGSENVSETLAKDYGFTTSNQVKGHVGSIAEAMEAITKDDDFTVCGSPSTECTFKPTRDHAFLEALLKVNLYNSGPADHNDDDNFVVARKKFSEPTTDFEEPTHVVYAYIRVANIDGTALVLSSDESVTEDQPLWAGFRCTPAASVQCHLLSPSHHTSFFSRLPAGSYHDSLFPDDKEVPSIEAAIAHSIRTSMFEQVTLPHCVEVPSCMVNAGARPLPTHGNIAERDPRMVHDLIEDYVAGVHPTLAPLAPQAPDDEDAEAAYHAFRYPADMRPEESEASMIQEVHIHPNVEALCLSAIRETSTNASPTRGETPTSLSARDSRLKALLPPSYRDRVITPKRGFSSSSPRAEEMMTMTPVSARVVPAAAEQASYSEPAAVPPLPLARPVSTTKHYPRRDYIFTTPRHHRPAALQSPLRRRIFSGESPRACSTPLNAEDSMMLQRYKDLRSDMLVEEGREEEVPLGTHEEKLIFAKLLEKERKKATEEEEGRFRSREQVLQEALVASRNAAIAEQQRNLAEQREREEEREKRATEAMERLAALEAELTRTREESEQQQIEAEIRRAAEEEERRQQEREEADRAEAVRRHEEEAATLLRIANTERALDAVRHTLDNLTSAPPRVTKVQSSRASSTASSDSSSLFDSSASGSSMDSSIGTPTRQTENPDDTPRTKRKLRRRARHETRKIKAKRLRKLLKDKDAEQKAHQAEEQERQRKEDIERQERLAEAERGLRELKAKVFESNQDQVRQEDERRRASQEEELKAKIQSLEAQVRGMGETKDLDKEEALVKLVAQLAEERRAFEKEREERQARDAADAERRDQERRAAEAERRKREDEDRQRILDTERALALLVAQQEREEKDRERREREEERLRREEMRLSAETAKAAALAAAEEERRQYREEEERKEAQREANSNKSEVDDGSKERINAMENALISLQAQVLQQNEDQQGSNPGSRQRTPRSLGSRVPTPKLLRNGSTASLTRPPLPPLSRTHSNTAGSVATSVQQETEKERMKRLRREEKVAVRAAKQKEREERKIKRREEDNLIDEIIRGEEGLDHTPASVTRGTSALFRDTSVLAASPAPTNLAMNPQDLESPAPVTVVEAKEKDVADAPHDDDDQAAPLSDHESVNSDYKYGGSEYNRSQLNEAKAVSITPEDLASDHLLTDPKQIEMAERKLVDLFGGNVNASLELVGTDADLSLKGFGPHDYILTFNGTSVDSRQGLLYAVYNSFCVVRATIVVVTVTVLRTNGTLDEVRVGDESYTHVALDSTNGQTTIEGLLKEFVQPSSRHASRSRMRDHSKRRGDRHSGHSSARSLSRNLSGFGSGVIVSLADSVIENGTAGSTADVDNVTPRKDGKEKKVKDKSEKKAKHDRADKHDKAGKHDKADKHDKVDKSKKKADKKEKKDKKRAPSEAQQRSHSGGSH